MPACACVDGCATALLCAAAAEDLFSVFNECIRGVVVVTAFLLRDFENFPMMTTTGMTVLTMITVCD